MKNIALGIAIILFLGVLTIVLAHKEEPTPVNRYGMAFTLDDALKSAASKQEKRTLYGIPGELNSASMNSAASAAANSEAAVSSSADSATTQQSSNSNDATITTTVDPMMDNGDLVTIKDSGDKDSPAEGSIVLGASASIGGGSNSADEDDAKAEDDQRIVFIERLMGLHLSGGAPGPDGQPIESSSASADDNSADGPSPSNKGIKWASRTRKFTFPLGSASITTSSGGPMSNDAVGSPDGPIPHPMLRYAAAAMMSRLIAAAARAQMEAQARDAIMSRMSGPKDKDDDANEDESVPVLLASLRSEERPIPFGRPNSGNTMYGRPMPRSRGAPRPSMSSMSHRVMVPPPMSAQSQAGVHPLLAQLQALHALSRLQMKQREGRGSASIMTSSGSPLADEIEISRGNGPSGRGQPALVMVAIPIGAESQGRPQQLHPMMSPYGMSPMAASGYAGALPSPVVSQYPRAYSPYHPSGYSRPQVHPISYAALGPMGASSAYGHPSIAASHPHASYYRPPPPQMYQRHPYSMRQVIEVPVEVPVPVHVPVPVAYPIGVPHPSMARMDSMLHPMVHPAMSMGHPMMMAGGHSHRMMAPDDSEGGPEGHQDQIVLFYDAELHDKEGEGENGNNNGNDDLQSSASEHRSLDGQREREQQREQLRSFFPMSLASAQERPFTSTRGQHPLFMIPSRSVERSMGLERSLDRATGQERMSGQAPTPANLNRLRLLREIAKRSEAMAAASNGPQVRVFQAGNGEEAEVIQGRPAVTAQAASEPAGQPAFIILAQDDQPSSGNNNNNNAQNPVERR